MKRHVNAVKIFLAVALFLVVGAAALADTSDVTMTKLDNGLTILTKEIHTAPVVDLSVWYHVGSRNETTGMTGISHAIEHMAFKGSKNFPEAGEADRMIRDIGGSGNAGTNTDYTVFYETVPAGKQDTVIDIEADRMNNLLFRPEDFKSEKKVIEEERKMRNEDSPTGLFWEEINAAAFKAHPYGWPVIGWMADIEGLNTDTLKAYYKAHYAPNNATVVVAGDFNTDAVLAKIKSAFGGIPAGAQPPMNVVEPEQKVEKQIIYRSDKTSLAHVVYAFHAPAITGADSPALEVAAAVLSSGRESRLYKSLVESGLAGDAEADFDTNQDPYLFYIDVEVQPGRDTADIQKQVEAEIEKLKNEPISDYELQRARNRFAAQEIFSDESISEYAMKLGWYQIAAGDYKYLDKYLDMTEKVSADAVQQAAKKYLIPENRTIGILLPKLGPGGAPPAQEEVSPHGDYHYHNAAQSGPRTGREAEDAASGAAAGSLPKIDFSSHVKKRVLPNGLTLIVYENPTFPVVHARGTIRGAGAFGDPADKKGLAQLVARAIRRGTTTRSYEDINKALEFVGADMDVSSGNEQVVFDGQFLKKDFDMGLGILADVLMNPVFPKDGVEIERGVALSDVAEIQKNNRQRAWQAFSNIIYAGHPYSNPSAGTADGLKAVTIDDLKKFHDAAYRPDRTILVLAGDITESSAAALAEKYFGPWAAPDNKPFKVPPVPKMKKAKTVYVTMPEKMQDVFYLGFPSVKPNDPDYYTFELMSDIFAGRELTSRLYNIIREKNGLVYYVFGQNVPRTGAATFQIVGGLAPENLDRAMDMVRSEIRRIQKEPVTDQELSEAKSFAIGQMPLNLETNEGVAGILSDLAYFGRPADVIDNYPATIQKITADAIMSVARKLLNADVYAAAVAGPTKAPEAGAKK